MQASRQGEPEWAGTRVTWDLTAADGGRIVFEGTPAALVAARSTLTGQHLAAYVGT